MSWIKTFFILPHYETLCIEKQLQYLCIALITWCCLFFPHTIRRSYLLFATTNTFVIKVWNDFFLSYQLLFVMYNYRNVIYKEWILIIKEIESNTGKSARQANLRHPKVRFQSIADEARRVSEGLKYYPRVSEISLSCIFCRCLILFLTFISSF